MICPNCGKECSEEEIFCRKCGTKIGINPHVTRNEENDNNTTDDYDLNNIVSGISTPNAESEPVKEDNTDQPEIEETQDELVELGTVDDDDFGEFGDEKDEVEDSDSGKTYSSLNIKNQTPEKKKKTKTIVVITIIAILVAVLGTLTVRFFVMSAKFDKFYSAGNAYFDKKNYPDARTQYLQAAGNAITRDQKLKSYSKVYETDEFIGGYDKEEIDFLEALVSIDRENVEYYKELIILYQNNDMASKIEPLVAGAPESVKKALEGFDGTIPVSNFKEGKYNKPIDVELTATNDVKIYYTLDGSKVEDSSTRKEYNGPIKLNDEKIYTLRAASKNKNGKFSKEFQAKYTLDFTQVKEPSVNLESGKYSEQKMIEVTCDKGCSVFYTKDGSIPTAKSKKYIKAIKLPKGTSLFYFVAINADGVSSGVVTRAYDYSPDYSFSYDEALNALSSRLVSQGDFEEKNGTFKDGRVGYLNYKSTEEIDGSFYYVIQVEIDKKNGGIESTSYYAVSTDSGEVEEVKRSGGSYKIK